VTCADGIFGKGNVLGSVMQIGGQGSPGQDANAQISAAFHAIDPSRYPATVAVADSLPVPLPEEFSFGLELLLDGLSRQRDRAAD
jgi:hypothetical protein